MAEFASDVDLVGRWLDGPYPCGLQIAEPSIVAAACDTTVVTPFRPMEHAHGGSGAPLMQFLDYVAFRDIGPVLTLNIGGIANCQLADADRRRIIAFDTGPGNVMLDHAARVLLGKPYDADGAAPRVGRSTRLCSRASFSMPSFAASRLAAPDASTSARQMRTVTSPKTGISAMVGPPRVEATTAYSPILTLRSRWLQRQLYVESCRSRAHSGKAGIRPFPTFAISPARAENPRKLP